MVSDRSIDKHSNNWRQTGSHLNMNLLKTEKRKRRIASAAPLHFFTNFYTFIVRAISLSICVSVAGRLLVAVVDVFVGIVCCRLQVCFMLLVSLLNEVHVCCRWHLAVNSNINIINF